MNRTPPQCGTQAGYNVHVRLGEPICEPCRRGHNAYVAAQQAAARSVARAYPQAYRDAFDRELQVRLARLRQSMEQP